MKTKLIFVIGILTSVLCFPSFAQTSAFTYQGQLKLNGTPANGLYDFMFRLMDAPTSGTAAPVIPINLGVVVSNGLFTTGMDFGAENFGGANLWLEVSVRTNGGGGFSTLSPRQLLTSTPYAIRAASASNLLGTLPAAQLSGTILNASLPASPSFSGTVTANSFSGNGANVTNVNAATLGGLGAQHYWSLGGNGGVGGPILGTTDSQPLRLYAGNRRALHLDGKTVSLGGSDSWSAVNITGGSSVNVISNGVMGGTIGGGGIVTNHAFGLFEAVPNIVLDSFGTIGGGLNNSAGHATVLSPSDPEDGRAATVAGGEGNAALGHHSAVGGGSDNRGESANSTIAGGANNTIYDNGLGSLPFVFANGSCVGGGENNGIAARLESLFSFSDALDSVISGGSGNSIYGASYAAIPGGLSNAVTGAFGLAAGRRAKANHAGAFVWADSTDADFASTVENQFSIRATGGIRLSDNTPNISFGAQTRQMLNLWGAQYGIGVQSYTMYFRTDAAAGFNGFSWYKGGTHSDIYADPGGGIELMHLIDGGLYVHGTFNNTSDRNAKENFTPVASREILEKVVALPITRWNYKHDAATLHLGPVAQDFYAAFAVGPDDKHIATVDESGVALAAIQGLNEKVEVRSQNSEIRIQKLEAENTALKSRLEKIEKLLQNRSGS